MRSSDPATDSPHYDVIIVGGRPAGSTLAARLGQQGLRVLLLERDLFPSPTIGAPLIYTRTMKLLDEIGAQETDYARNTPRLYRWVNEFFSQFRADIPIPALEGRNYSYALDRAGFDEALWRTAAHFSSVTARQPFAVTDLLWEGNCVIGVRGRSPNGNEEIFTADCVVGADGRFSTLARKVQAPLAEENTRLPTTLYYAYWKNAEPYDANGPAIHFCQSDYGYYYLLCESANNTLAVSIEGRASIFTPTAGQIEALYTRMLREQPLVWRRLAAAERVTEVRGLRHIRNLYRQAGGVGWVLVGDAFHQKDPLDGQGVYDAIFSAKILSQVIGDWKTGVKTWEQALTEYEDRVRAETYAMYQETLKRVKLTLYAAYPRWMYQLILRWVSTDPELNRRYGLLTVRSIDPANWLPPSVMLGGLFRGAMSDFHRMMTHQPHPSLITPPPNTFTPSQTKHI